MLFHYNLFYFFISFFCIYNFYSDINRFFFFNYYFIYIKNIKKYFTNYLLNPPTPADGKEERVKGKIQLANLPKLLYIINVFQSLPHAVLFS